MWLFFILETQNTMFRTILNMKHTMNEMSLKLGRLEIMQTEFHENINKYSQISAICDEYIEFISNFPLHNEEQLQEFETKLCDRVYKQKLVSVV